MKPLVRSPVDSSRDPALVSNTHEITPSSGLHPNDATRGSSNRPHSMSRHDSFDQKLDKLQANEPPHGNGKRRKKSRSGSNGSSGIAGNIGSGIGSPRNMAADDGRMRSAASYEQDLNNTNHLNPHKSSRRHLNISSGSINRFAPPPAVPQLPPPMSVSYYPGYQDEVQIPIQRVDSNFERRNYQTETINVNEYPDPRVAYRLASN